MVCLRDAFQPAGREKDEEREGVEELAAELKLTIEEEKCVGCGICVVVCEENRLNEEVIYGKGGRGGGREEVREEVREEGREEGRGKEEEELVLRVEEGVVRLADAGRCKRSFEPPEFCRACVDHCPTDAIKLL